MSSTPTSSFASNPSTPAYSNDADWITAYLSVHTMSEPSWRYGYLLWIIVVFIFLVFAILHWTGSRGGSLGAAWSKWSIRRRTWRKKHNLAMAKLKNQPHRQPFSLPSNAQLLSLFTLFLAAIALSVVGPDYITPNDRLWQFQRRSSTSALGTRAVTYDPTAFQPQYTIWKAWWTAGGRTGLVAFALLPLCTLLALKAPPFAVFAVPFMIQLYFDKLACLHRWSGRLIWLISTAHVALWTVQLVRDQRESTGKMALSYAWQEPRFIYGWVSFGFLTLLIGCSVPRFRRSHYEAFYFLHILLVPLFLVTAAFHHPPVWWWCWAALALWVGERLWRTTWWLHINGYFGGMSPQPSSTRNEPGVMQKYDKRESWEMHSTHTKFNTPGQYLDSPGSSISGPRRPISPPHSYQPTYKSPLGPSDPRRSPIPPSHEQSTTNATFNVVSPSSPIRMSSMFPQGPYIPPPGYAHAELLSGRTIRLRFISPGFLSWAPGQHFLINIPSVSKFTSHPFTVASVCDECGPDSGRIMVILVRAKNGWTKDLWDAVAKLINQGQKYPNGEHPTKGAEMPFRGVLVRMYVDGPFGSSIRARWGTHSTVLIIAGGSGVSFGLSVLQYISMCLAGRDGRQLGVRPGGWGKKGFLTSRVRFVWLVREFCHVQWGATILRRCMALVPPSGLQINIFVTNFTPLPPTISSSKFPETTSSSQTIFPYDIRNQDDDFAPPTPGFAVQGHGHSRTSASSSSAEFSDSGEDSIETYVDLSYYTGDLGEQDYQYRREDRESNDFAGPEYEDHILDLTNFDGDYDIVLPGEEVLNRSVKKQGKLRRAKTRKAAKMSIATKQKSHDWHTPLLENRSNLNQIRDSQPVGHSYVSKPSTDTTFSTDKLPYLSLISTAVGHRLSTALEVSPADPVASYSESHPQSPPITPRTSQYGATEGLLNTWDTTSDIASIPRPGVGVGEDVRLEIDDQEMNDVDVISEHVRPGKPKLDRIIADEIHISEGSMIVACCGPVSLNAMVRKVIASKIDPARVRRGDMRGMISLVSEEFEY